MNEPGSLGDHPGSGASLTERLGGVDVVALLGALGSVGAALHDSSGRVIAANDALAELLGVPLEQLVDYQPFKHPLPVEVLAAVAEGTSSGSEVVDHLRDVLDGRVASADARMVVRRPDGRGQQLLCSMRPLTADDGRERLAVVTFVDETARSELELAERTVARSMQVLLRATDPESLLQQMCDTIVETGYSLAWIVEVAGAGVLCQVATAGADEHLEQGLATRVRLDAEGRGPVATALRSGEVQVIDEFETDERVAPWREWARAHRFGSSIAIPFALGPGREGALNIYAERTHAFGPGTVTMLLALARDLELGLRHLHTSAALSDSEERFRFLAENTGDVVMLSRDGKIDWISPAVHTLFGWEPEELIGQPFDVIGHPDEEELRARARIEAPHASRTTYRGRVRRRDGTFAWVDARTRLFHDVDGDATDVIISTLWDATNEVTAQEALAHAASHDALTGLANRTLLLDELERALAGGRRSGLRTAVLLIDLDHFKYVNDSLGHAVGDALLCVAADRMSGTVRQGDLVARPGGDEFVVVMRNLATVTEAVGAAERLLERFRSPIPVGDAELFTTASIGIAMTDGRDQDALDLLREADSAMYRAKSEGRDRLSVFNEDLRSSATRRLSTATDLRRAIERDELDVWFQPEVSLLDGSLLAVEALVRWHHPSGETLTAGAFIETAEETGMILGIGRRVLDHACHQAARWRTRRPDAPLTVRVNLSAVQLGEAGLLQDLDEALAASELSPDGLCLEITETAMLHETGTVRTNMAGIIERGVQVAIDDFGTGYASLTYLRRYPVSAVKLDRSFVTNLVTDEHDRQIAAGIIDLAHRLGIHVTAEGVEQPDQAELLRALGCTSAQGYLYAPAVPAEELERRFPGHLGGG